MVNTDVTAHTDQATVLAWLGEVMDPEIPVVSVVDLGIVRDVRVEGDACTVTVTPTYSGCPATEVIAKEIERALCARGLTGVTVRTQLSPAWTTDWMSQRARDALRVYGITAPAHSAAQAIDIRALLERDVQAVPCPRCASFNTRMLARFGSTPCKALYQCSDCREPFDYFKPH